MKAWEYVDSSNIESIGYDNLSCVLEVELKSGRIYQYFDVPEHVYSELKNASSVGGYFNQNIRNNFSTSEL